MILKSIKLKNIRSFLDEKIGFPTGSLLLSGDIGSGKSTILLAIDFVLFGLRRGELSGSDLLRHGKNSGSVELVFSVFSGLDFWVGDSRRARFFASGHQETQRNKKTNQSIAGCRKPKENV